MKTNFSIKILAAAALAITSHMSFAQAAAPSPAKQALITKLIQLQTPGIDGIGQMMLQQPVNALAQGVRVELQKQPEAKREALAKSVDAEMRKFIDEVVPMIRERGQKLAAPTWTPLLDERFSEDELKTIIAWLESPTSRKYQQSGGEMMNLLGQKLAEELRPTLEPKLKALDASLAKQLGMTAPKPAAPAASPAKK